jgi:8-hydroxy-5-deazaflavin:NADPH oxidoreductase
MFSRAVEVGKNIWIQTTGVRWLMKILIIGAGNVGAALGRGWAKCGHDVMYAVPDPESSRYAELPPDSVRPLTGNPNAEVVVLAVPFAAARSALEALGDLGGAVLIDCTNPVSIGPDGPRLTVGFYDSAGEQVARWAQNARVVKTLNQTGADNMASALGYPSMPVMFVAGDDPEAKRVVSRLVSDLLFDPIDAGPLVQARLLEPYAVLWIALAVKQGQGRDFALSLMRKKTR